MEAYELAELEKSMRDKKRSEEKEVSGRGGKSKSSVDAMKILSDTITSVCFDADALHGARACVGRIAGKRARYAADGHTVQCGHCAPPSWKCRFQERGHCSGHGAGFYASLIYRGYRRLPREEGFEDYADHFLAKRMNGRALLQISESYLAEMPEQSLPMRAGFLELIAELKAAQR